ncbi:MAG: Phosphate transport system permease protein PstA [Chloroflexota bacterium]|nr:phosphate ABC transporter permease PstA [Dehalococcoidia bacterium]MQG52323.1 phosphate ABC transporter permease PstA [SAR202 cluster bacterium]MQG60201.1 phosphate ABC transporter permease PstA [SAR202 cluster bacterium]CAI8255181.1 MAG: Phosphate transport system permease protein PstA [Chloroflexota bacterium]|tara:strand:+ start:34808 stop:35692 length:885 start_codon:yes stop_codon:yes gene_type:complete
MQYLEKEKYQQRLAQRQRTGKIFEIMCIISITIGIGMLALLLWYVADQGLHKLDWQFLTSFPSRFPERAGIYGALLGTLYVIGTGGLIAFVLGVGTAIYLEEYANDNRLSRILQVNIANLAGVPSIVYGILGLEIFVRFAGLGRSVLAGSLTIALLILPIVIIASQEALKAVPSSIREGGFALGASKWQVVSILVIPQAFASILTGVILAVSRAIGETAPLIVMGALTFVPFAPDGFMSPFTVLPIQIFNWVSRPQHGFHEIAAAGIVVLLITLILLNSVAIYLRHKFSKNLEG